MNIYWNINKINQNVKEVKKNIERSRKRERGPLGPTSASRWWGPNPLFFLIFLSFLDFLNILFDFIDSSIGVHDLPSVLEPCLFLSRKEGISSFAGLGCQPDWQTTKPLGGRQKGFESHGIGVRGQIPKFSLKMNFTPTPWRLEPQKKIKNQRKLYLRVDPKHLWRSTRKHPTIWAQVPGLRYLGLGTWRRALKSWNARLCNLGLGIWA